MRLNPALARACILDQPSQSLANPECHSTVFDLLSALSHCWRSRSHHFVSRRLARTGLSTTAARTAITTRGSHRSIATTCTCFSRHGPTTPARRAAIQTNPLIVGGTLYAYTPKTEVIALDAATGKLKWKFDSGIVAGQPARGVTYWNDGAARPHLRRGDELPLLPRR